MSNDEDHTGPRYQSVGLAVSDEHEVEVATDRAGNSGAIMRRGQQRVDIDIRHGPLPSPDDIAAYERACPGMGMEIVALAKVEQSNRHERDLITRRSDAKIRERGQIAGAAILLTFFGASIYLLTHGIPIAGFISLVTSAVGALGAASANRKKPTESKPAPAAPPAPAPTQPTDARSSSTEIAVLPRRNKITRQ